MEKLKDSPLTRLRQGSRLLKNLSGEQGGVARTPKYKIKKEFVARQDAET